MIFEWYVGADKEGKIPRRLTELLRQASDVEDPERVVEEILKLLEEEKDPNAKAQICYTAATVSAKGGRYERYEELCRKALKYFDPLAANFQGVVEEYVQSNYAATDKSGDTSDECIEHNIPLELAALVWADRARLDEEDYAILLRGLANFFSLCGERYGSPVFWKLSEICHIRAHHEFSEDPYCLAGIARAKQELGDEAGFERIRRMVEELGYDVYNLPEP